MMNISSQPNQTTNTLCFPPRRAEWLHDLDDGLTDCFLLIGFNSGSHQSSYGYPSSSILQYMISCILLSKPPLPYLFLLQIRIFNKQRRRLYTILHKTLRQHLTHGQNLRRSQSQWHRCVSRVSRARSVALLRRGICK